MPRKPDLRTEAGQPDFERHLARPGARRSFEAVEKQARDLLREKGFSESQIDRELSRAKRRDLDEQP